ncbi:unnamed protein product, partial [Brenthis ino]
MAMDYTNIYWDMTAEELASLRKQCVQSLYECTDYVLKYLDGDEKKIELDNLKSYIQGYCSLDELSSKGSGGLICEDDSFDDIKKKVEEWLPNSKHSNHHYMTSFLNKIKNKEASSSQKDPELVITCTNQQQIDPYSKEPIQIPVKNTFCGHVYDKKSILKYMGVNSRAKCPYMGCSNAVLLTKECLVCHEMPVEMNSTTVYNKM